jgi:probable rRNA maturation factor
MHSIYINYYSDEVLPVSLETLNNIVDSIINKFTNYSNSEISIVLVEDIEIQKLNKLRRDINKPTDVLSFPSNHFPKAPYQILGEIYISLETCKRQSIDIGHSYMDEFFRLLVHGFLHLLGFDHINQEDEIIMQKKEDELLDFILKIHSL